MACAQCTRPLHSASWQNFLLYFLPAFCLLSSRALILLTELSVRFWWVASYRASSATITRFPALSTKYPAPLGLPSFAVNLIHVEISQSARARTIMLAVHLQIGSSRLAGVSRLAATPRLAAAPNRLAVDPWDEGHHQLLDAEGRPSEVHVRSVRILRQGARYISKEVNRKNTLCDRFRGVLM